MDELIGLLAAILFWRVVIAILAGLLISSILGLLVPTFGATAAILLTVIAFGVGIGWHVSATTPAAKPGEVTAENQPISRPIAFLGLALVGILWGGLVEYATGSYWIAFAVLLVTPFLLGPVADVLTRQPVYLKDLIFTSAAMVLGAATPFGIGAFLS